MMRFLCFWKRHEAAEAAKQARLAAAEGDLAELKSRANRAISTLDDRHGRNHYREAVEQMITGAC